MDRQLRNSFDRFSRPTGSPQGNDLFVVGFNRDQEMHVFHLERTETILHGTGFEYHLSDAVVDFSVVTNFVLGMRPADIEVAEYSH